MKKTPRREFLRQASLIAAGSVAVNTLEAQAAAAPAAPPQQGTWDMSWSDRVTGRYKMAFDAHQVSGGVCLHQVRVFLAGYASAFGLADRDVSAVLVIRHAAIPMVLADPLWADAPWGEDEKLKDPASGEVAKRNPFINIPENARYSVTWPDGALDTLMQRGVVVLACDIALSNAAAQLSSRRKIPRADARQLVADNLLPGVYRMPSGIFATAHAQQLGCGVLNSV
jgi:intracellular sulfur oxidation DsrE/DsrF family protein